MVAGGCGGDTAEPAQTTPPAGLPQGAEPVRLDPANFTTEIDNPYMPVRPGSVWIYSDRDPSGAPQRDVVRVLRRTKVIAGIRARVVHDRATRGSRLIEDTFDWFAQDRQGNVWYLGEATQAYSNGDAVVDGGVVGGRGARGAAGSRDAGASARRGSSTARSTARAPPRTTRAC